MEWTRERPEKSGYYWAYENLPPEDADILFVAITLSGTLRSIYGDFLGFDHFSHWLGPLEKPEPPKDA